MEAERLLPCPECDGDATRSAQEFGWLVYCNKCYDPSPVHSGDRFRDLHGIGRTEAEAAHDWNEAVTLYRWDEPPDEGAP